MGEEGNGDDKIYTEGNYCYFGNIPPEKVHEVKDPESLTESYKEFDGNVINTYVRNWLNTTEGNFESTDDLLNELTDYLSDVLQGVDVVNAWSEPGVRWVTNNIMHAQCDGNGYIQIAIGAEQLVDDFKMDKEEGWDFKKDSDLVQFCQELGHVLVHEMVHRYQFTQHMMRHPKDFKTDYYKYLATKDEIDAHAIAAVEEARSIGYTDDQILKRISSGDEYSDVFDAINELDACTEYAMFFDSDDEADKEVVKRFLKVMANYILKDRMDESKNTNLVSHIEEKSYMSNNKNRHLSEKITHENSTYKENNRMKKTVFKEGRPAKEHKVTFVFEPRITLLANDGWVDKNISDGVAWDLVDNSEVNRSVKDILAEDKREGIDLAEHVSGKLEGKVTHIEMEWKERDDVLLVHCTVVGSPKPILLDLQRYLEGQMSDGWGEAFEQQELSSFTVYVVTDENDPDNGECSFWGDYRSADREASNLNEEEEERARQYEEDYDEPMEDMCNYEVWDAEVGVYYSFWSPRYSCIRAILIDGYDANGFDSDGYDKEGFNRWGRNSDGYDREGYNSMGRDKDGYDKAGYDRAGKDRDGFDKEGYKDLDNKRPTDKSGREQGAKFRTDKSGHVTISNTFDMGENAKRKGIRYREESTLCDICKKKKAHWQKLGTKYCDDCWEAEQSRSMFWERKRGR